MILLTELFDDYRNFSDFSPRHLWEEMVFYLLIESSENLGRKPIPRNISRSTCLEIDPGIITDRESINNFESNMVHHKNVPEDIPDDNRNAHE